MTGVQTCALPISEARYAAAPWLRDALFAACRICSHMALSGARLRGLSGQIPAFTLRRRELPLDGDRGTLMQALLRRLPGAEPAGEGLRLYRGEGSAYLVPLTRRSALRVVGEAVLPSLPKSSVLSAPKPPMSWTARADRRSLGHFYSKYAPVRPKYAKIYGVLFLQTVLY